MAKIKESDEVVARAYEQCQARPLGNLHERMKYVFSLAEKERKSISNSMWHAICDLRTEVKYHKPASPPFGRRALTIKHVVVDD